MTAIGRAIVTAIVLVLSLSAAQPTFGSNGGRIAGDPSDFGVIALGGVGVVVEAPSLGDLVVGDMGSTVPAGCDFGRRAILRFPLDSLGSQPPAAATLSLAIVESRRDQFPAPGTIDQTPPFSNPGLGAIHVVHIADQPTPTVLAYATPSTGNDPGVLIPADGEPDTRVTVDATAAVRQAVLEGATFVDFRVQADIETDFDCLNDAFFFWSGNQTDPARQPSIEYTTASDTTPPVLTVPAGITADATSPPGAVVSYTVSATDAVDPAPVVVCTPLSGATFPIGETTVNCSATDASGNTATAAFVVYVRSAPEQLERLAAVVAGAGTGTSLADKIAEARGALAIGDTSGACSILAAFVREVSAQSDKHVPAATAVGLTADAARISNVLDC